MPHKVRYEYLDDVELAARADGFVPYYDLASGKMAFIDPATFGGVTFDAGIPATETVADAGAVGSGTTVNHANHKHPMPGPFVASGASHASGFVPDPGASSGSTKFLREDATFAIPAAGAGGGASSADHFIVGMGGEGDTDLSAKVIIPGLSGSPDIRVAGTNDDEFDQNGSGTPSGWTDITSGAANTIDTNTFKSHLHLKANAGAGTAWKGIYKTSPSMPFTMTAKFSDATSISNFNYAAIGVGAADSTGAFSVTGIQHNNNGIYTACVTVYTNRTTVSAGVVSGGNLSARTPLYFRIVATSSTNISYYLSYNGMFWHPINVAHNPGFTIAIVAIMVNSESAADACELYCDWVRFT